MSHSVAVGMVDELIDPILLLGRELGESRVGLQLQRGAEKVRLQTQIRSDPLFAVVPIDLVTTETAILEDQVITMRDFGSRHFGILMSRFQLRHIMVALQT